MLQHDTFSSPFPFKNKCFACSNIVNNCLVISTLKPNLSLRKKGDRQYHQKLFFLLFLSYGVSATELQSIKFCWKRIIYNINSTNVNVKNVRMYLATCVSFSFRRRILFFDFAKTQRSHSAELSIEGTVRSLFYSVEFYKLRVTVVFCTDLFFLPETFS